MYFLGFCYMFGCSLVSKWITTTPFPRQVCLFQNPGREKIIYSGHTDPGIKESKNIIIDKINLSNWRVIAPGKGAWVHHTFPDYVQYDLNEYLWKIFTLYDLQSAFITFNIYKDHFTIEVSVGCRGKNRKATKSCNVTPC